MPTFDEIFKRWVDNEPLTQDDIIPILMEYVTVFEKGEFDLQKTLAFIRIASSQYFNGQNMLNITINNALKLVGIKKNYHWAEIYDVDGQFKGRIWQPQNGLIQN